MKNLFFILTIGGLLWLFFNPNGILKYNSKSNEVRQLNKKYSKNEEAQNIEKTKFDWLTEYIKSIKNNDKEVQKHILEHHGSEIGIELIIRNLFKKDLEALKIKKKGLKK